MKLNSIEYDLWQNYINGNISDFKEALNKMNKHELIDFIYNIQEQSLAEANEILSIVRKYINEL